MPKLKKLLCLLCCAGLLLFPAAANAKTDGGTITGVDIDRDGKPETLVVHTVMDYYPVPYLTILDNQGRTLFSMMFDETEAHPALGIFLCTVDEQPYILIYENSCWQGFGSYYYGLYRLDKKSVFESTGGTIEDINGGSKLVCTICREVPYDMYGQSPLDAKEMVAFRDELNALLKDGTLLMGMDMDTCDAAELYKKGARHGWSVEYTWIEDEFCLPRNFYKATDSLETRLQKYSDYAAAMWKTDADTWR